ncbi:MAG TPA: glycosyltransferase [Phycisphaerales bacterium]|nr:glycosyltransferase [Phycisphaerales bacterium]
MPMLSVIIPMYNEADRIGATVADVCATLRSWGTTAEVLLVDDGSTDATVDAAEPLCGDHGDALTLRLIRHGVNQGKGAAVRTGMRAARGGWVVFMDADNSTRLAELEKLNAEARATGAPIIIASRSVAGAEALTTPARRAAGRAFRACLTLLGLDLARDTQCGFKLYRGDAAAFMAAHAIEDGFAFDVEHLLLARRAGLAVREVGVRWDHRTGGSIRVVRHGLQMLWAAVRIRHRVRRMSLTRPSRATPGPLLVEVKPLQIAPSERDTVAAS